MLAAIYVRVSGDSQADNYSLPTQEAACRAYAAREGYTVSEAHLYREVHTASELHERPQLGAVREAMRKGEFGALICFDPDRFSRKQVHTAILQDMCERAGVVLKFAMFDFEETATGRFMLGARAFAAELELEKIKERTMRGMRAKVASGKMTGRAHAPWGYRYDADRTKLLIDAATAPYVRSLFARAASGEATHALATWLTASGIPAPQGGARWYRSTVRIILRNVAYTGEARALTTRNVRERGKVRKVRLEPGEGVALPEGTVPALIDRATWDAVQVRLERNKGEARRRNEHPEEYLLRAGFVVCGICGRSVTARWRSQAGVRYPIYVAEKDRHARCAPNGRDFRMHARKLDALVWQAVLEHLFDPARLIDDRELGRPGDPAAETLASVERLIAEVERAIRNITAGIGALDEEEARTPLLVELRTLATRRTALAAEREALLARRADWAAHAARQNRLVDYWLAQRIDADALTYQGRRDLLADLGIVVKLYPHGSYRVITPDAPGGLGQGSEAAIAHSPSSSGVHSGRWITLAAGGPAPWAADRGPEWLLGDPNIPPPSRRGPQRRGRDPRD